MKALKYGFGLALIGGFTLMAACGGSSSDSDDSSAGSSSAGASSTTAGQGSTTAGTGSSLGGDTSVAGGETAGSGTTAGGPGQGGTSSSAGGPAMGGAGKSGTAGAGGAAATNPKDCPAALPSGACMPLANNQERCTYGDQSCRCRPPQGGGMNQAGAGGAAAAGDTWQCTTVPVCPTAKPTAGADCTSGNEVCQYTGEGACVCNNNTKKWQCFGGTTGNAGAGGMSGTAGAGGGTAATPCPQMKPAADATCSGNNLCQYGKGTGCICDGTNWVCN